MAWKFASSRMKLLVQAKNAQQKQQYMYNVKETAIIHINEDKPPKAISQA